MNKFTFLILGLLFFSCNNPAASDSTTSAKTENTVVEKPKKGATTSADFANIETLPSIELSMLENLWAKCDFIDYVYYELPISASLDNQNSIRTAISHIAENPAGKLPGCKAIGRVFYQIDGENVLQGDIYFSNGCTYFIWLDKKSKPYAGNMMMESGIQFFTSNVNAAMGNVPKQ